MTPDTEFDPCCIEDAHAEALGDDQLRTLRRRARILDPGVSEPAAIRYVVDVDHRRAIKLDHARDMHRQLVDIAHAEALECDAHRGEVRTRLTQWTPFGARIRTAGNAFNLDFDKAYQLVLDLDHAEALKINATGDELLRRMAQFIPFALWVRAARGTDPETIRHGYQVVIDELHAEAAQDNEIYDLEHRGQWPSRQCRLTQEAQTRKARMHKEAAAENLRRAYAVQSHAPDSGLSLEMSRRYARTVGRLV